MTAAFHGAEAADPTCRDCGMTLGGYTAVTEAPAPSAGDVSICAYCACISVFTGCGLEMRPPTEEELGTFAMSGVVTEAVALVRSKWNRLLGERP